MSLIEHSTTIALSPEQLFDFTQDYAMRERWDPFPERYTFLDGATQAANGVGLIVYAKNGFRMTVRYVSFQRPRAAAIEMVTGPWFIQRFAGTWQFVAISDSETRVTFKYNVMAGPKLLAWLIQPLLNRSFSAHAQRRLQGLALYFAKNVQKN